MALDLGKELSILNESECFTHEDDCRCPAHSAQSIHVVDIRPTGVTPDAVRTEEQHIATTADLDRFLQAHQTPPYKTRLYSINQSRTKRPLDISQQSLRKLFLRHEIMLGFCHVISCFQGKPYDAEEAYCAPFIERRDANVIEYAYVIKYPDKRRPKSNDSNTESWSVRQVGIYHRVRLSDGQNTVIALNGGSNTSAASHIRVVLESIRTVGECQHVWTRLNEHLMLSLLRQWRRYLGDHEERLHSAARIVQATRMKDASELDHQDLSDLRYLERRCSLIRPLLLAFLAAFDGFDSLALHLPSPAMSAATSQHTPCRDSWIANGRRCVQSQVHSADFVLSRCTAVAQAFQETLGIWNTLDTRRQTESVFKLTKWTVDDSATVTVVTIITLIYLSFTAVAVRSSGLPDL